MVVKLLFRNTTPPSLLSVLIPLPDGPKPVPPIPPPIIPVVGELGVKPVPVPVPVPVPDGGDIVVGVFPVPVPVLGVPEELPVDEYEQPLTLGSVPVTVAAPPNSQL